MIGGYNEQTGKLNKIAIQQMKIQENIEDKILDRGKQMN